MKAVVVYEAGGVDKLVYQEVPKPRIKEGWTLIKVRGFGINRSEIFTRKGYSPSVEFPRILGIECVGLVEESEKFEIGTKIVSIMGEMGRGFDEILEDKGYVLQTEETFDKVLELVGPRSIKDSIKHVNRFGVVCNAGQLGEQWYLEDFDPIMELKNDIYLTTFYSGLVDSSRLNEMFKFIDKYNVVARPSKVFNLNEIQEAHQYIESKKGFGKVVCLV